MELVPSNLISGSSLASAQKSKAADLELWNSFRNGSTSAYALIYQQHFFLLYNYGLKICPEREIVKDCIQDLFINIWKNRESLSATNSIKYYLFTALKRKLIDSYAYHSKYRPLSDSGEDFLLGSVPSSEQNLVNDQLTADQKKSIVSALEKLTSRQKEAILLKFYENLPNEDIASKMAISVEGVYNLISKALNKFRQNMSKAYWLLLLLFNL